MGAHAAVGTLGAGYTTGLDFSNTRSAIVGDVIIGIGVLLAVGAPAWR